MIVVVDEVLELRLAPGLVVSLEEFALFDREGGDSDAGEREVVGAVVASSLWVRVGDDGEVEAFGGGFDGGVEGGALGSVDVDLARDADGQDHVVVDVESDLRGGDGRVLAEVFAAEEALPLSAATAAKSKECGGLIPDCAQARASSRSMPTPVALSAAPL